MYKMYDELADWWLLISPLENYSDEVEFIKDILKDVGLPPAHHFLNWAAQGEPCLLSQTIFLSRVAFGPRPSNTGHKPYP